MRSLNEREKRTIRIASIGVTAYLTLFLIFQAWRAADRRHTEYQGLVREATNLKLKLGVYQDKVLVARDLMEKFRLDPARLSRTTIVAQATAAIQNAAISGGLQLGPIRESPARASGREITAVQLEGMGPVPAVLAFLHQIGSLGYPLVADALQLSPGGNQPGQVKMNVTIVILDFDQWKGNEEKPNA